MRQTKYPIPYTLYPIQRRRGFTLLELMVVIAVSGILAGIGVVSFVSVKRSTAVRLAAENFAGYVRTTESMTRSGTPFGRGAQRACNNDSRHMTTTPCGGYGVVIRGDGSGYDRYADLTPANVSELVLPSNPPQPLPPSSPLKDSSDVTVDQVTLSESVRITIGAGAQVQFVPPKDGICVYIGGTVFCGPRTSQTLTWKFGYGPSGGYPRTVTLNTVSGAVVVR